jgi:hypothetical protein
MTDIIKENILVYGLKWRILSMIKFKLKKEQIEFLKKMYPDNKLIQRVLRKKEFSKWMMRIHILISWIIWTMSL